MMPGLSQLDGDVFELEDDVFEQSNDLSELFNHVFEASKTVTWPKLSECWAKWIACTWFLHPISAGDGFWKRKSTISGRSPGAPSGSTVGGSVRSHPRRVDHLRIVPPGHERVVHVEPCMCRRASETTEI